jgi:hypothetical protein
MAPISRVRATIAYGLGGPGLGTFYFGSNTGSPTSAELLDMVARVRAFYNGLTALITPSTSVLVQGQVDTIDEATGTLIRSDSTTPPAAVVGTGTTTQLPPATAFVCQLNTSTVIGGRILRGRSFVGPLSALASTTSGAPTTAAGTAAVGAGTALLAVTTTISPRVWHRPKAAGSGASGAITGVTGWSSFGSLRSRRD